MMVLCLAGPSQVMVHAGGPARGRQAAPAVKAGKPAARPARAARLTRRHKEVRAFAESRGMAVGRPRTLAGMRQFERKVLAAEAQRARGLDGRISNKLYGTVANRFVKAMRLRPPRQRVLYGFSRLVDAKFALDQRAVDALMGGFDQAQTARVKDMIRRGPGPGGRWGQGGRIDSIEQLVAAVAHHQQHGNGAALQLSMTPAVEQALAQRLEAGKVSVSRAVGGASAFGANLAASYGGIDVAFHSAQTPSPTQTGLFSRRVRIINRKTGPRGQPASAAVADGKAPTKVNYIVESPPAQTLSILGQKVTTARAHGRIILSTEASYPATFDPKLTKRQLGDIARANDMFVAVGLHYITGEPAGKAVRTAATLRRQLRTMRTANPKLYVHYQYVRAKDPAKEHLLFQAMAGQIDSLSLNAVELGELGRNIDGHEMIPGKGPVVMPRSLYGKGADPNSPQRIYQLATAVMKATGLERMRVHGYDIDITLVAGGSAVRMEREALASLNARARAVNKAANPSGVIARPGERWDVMPAVSAEGMAAIQRFADHLGARGRLPAVDRERFVTEGTLVSKRKGGISIAATPTRRLYDLRGGLVSTGDTLDLTTLHMVGPGHLRPASR